MDDALRAQLRERAGGRCEYCRLHQEEYEYQTFHIEHIIAKQHGGTDDSDNLCLACAECNFSKGPNLAGLLDGKTGSGTSAGTRQPSWAKRTPAASPSRF